MPEKRKKIAIVIPTLGGGGAERVALASATDLAKRGHRVDLVLVQAKGELLPLVPTAVRIVDLKAHRLLAALRPLAVYLRQNRPDTLHAHMWPLTVIAILAHRLARSTARLIVSGHTFLSRHVTGRWRSLQLRWTLRYLYPLADVRTTCSEAAADDLARLSGLGRDQFEVVYNPIVRPQTIISTVEAEAAWRGPGQRVITVGSLKQVKNQALLLDAFARLKTADAQLMILGEGVLRPELERRAERLGIAGRVAMPGFALDPWPYLASAELFVLSSDYEGFPLVLAEAMHAGLKVVSTDCTSGPREILDHGRYGRLVPCGDVAALTAVIDAALAEPAQPKKMRDRATAVAGGAMIDRYYELLTAR